MQTGYDRRTVPSHPPPRTPRQPGAAVCDTDKHIKPSRPPLGRGRRGRPPLCTITPPADAVAGVLTLRLPRLPTEARSSSSEAWGERGGKQREVTRDTHGEPDAQLPAGRGRPDPDTAAAGQSGRPKVSGAPAAGCSRLRLRRAVSGKTRPYCRLSAVIDFAGRLQIRSLGAHDPAKDSRLLGKNRTETSRNLSMFRNCSNVVPSPKGGQNAESWLRSLYLGNQTRFSHCL